MAKTANVPVYPNPEHGLKTWDLGETESHALYGSHRGASRLSPDRVGGIDLD